MKEKEDMPTTILCPNYKHLPLKKLHFTILLEKDALEL